MKKEGFTIIEIIISLAVLAILFAIIIFNVSVFRNKQVVANAKDELVASLSESRGRSVAGYLDSTSGVYLGTSSIYTFIGSSFDIDDPETVLTFSSEAISIETDLAGGGSEIIFDRLTGNTSQSGSVTIESVSDSSRTVTVDILSSGLINE